MSNPLRCLILSAWEPRMPEPGLRLGGRPESMRDPGRQDLHDGVERILGAILAQVGAVCFVVQGGP